MAQSSLHCQTLVAASLSHQGNPPNYDTAAGLMDFSGQSNENCGQSSQTMAQSSLQCQPLGAASLAYQYDPPPYEAVAGVTDFVETELDFVEIELD